MSILRKWTVFTRLGAKSEALERHDLLGRDREHASVQAMELGGLDSKVVTLFPVDDWE